MIKILILDDNALKSKKITDSLNQLTACKIDCASDLVTARKMLQESYDLLILDMNLPERFNETPKENNGISFIEELKKSNRLKQPNYIIGLSEYEELVIKYNHKFQNSGFALIKFDNASVDWEYTLQELVQHIKKAREQKSGQQGYDYDVAFITALRTPEFDSILDLKYDWNRKSSQTEDYSTYYIGSLINAKGKNIRVVASYLPQMGLVPAAFSTSKIINAFRPKYLIMTGICGGLKGAVSLGDVVICDSSFDLGSGKIILKDDNSEGFEPDFKPIPLAPQLKENFLEFSANKTNVRAIQDLWPGNRPANELSIKIGPVGSGAAVIANSKHIDKIKAHQRKLLAIDMETYSIFYCAQFCNTPSPIAISIKSVSDFADHQKDDNIQKYCSFISAHVADFLIREVLNFD